MIKWFKCKWEELKAVWEYSSEGQFGLLDVEEDKPEIITFECTPRNSVDVLFDPPKFPDVQEKEDKP